MQASTFGMIWGVIGGLVGGTIGAIYGGPAGAATGWSIGYTVGNLEGTYILGTLFPDKPHIYFPPAVKPHENRFQTSTWGTAVPIQYGCGRMAGNVIYMGEIKETQLSESHRQDGVRYYVKTLLYTCTIAIAFAEPIENIARIWMDRKVFADYRNPLSPLYPTGDNALAYVNWETSIARSAIYFSIHLGGESQTADASLAAILGAADTPAYRGVTYIVFPDFPIGEFQGLPTVEIEANPVPHGNLLIYSSSNSRVSLMEGLTGAVASYLQFSSPWPADTSGSLQGNVCITNNGDVAMLWWEYAGGVHTWRVYILDGISTTIKSYFDLPNPSSGYAWTGLWCEPTSGRFISSHYKPSPIGVNVWHIFEPDGTLVTSWYDSAAGAFPYNASTARVIGFLANPADPLAPGNMVVVYYGTYLTYIRPEDIFYVYESYLGGARIYPADVNYRIGPLAHDQSGSSYTGNTYFIPTHLTSDYLWAIKSDRLGYYKFKLEDLVEGAVSAQRVRITVPASCYHSLDPPHDADPAPGHGMAMTNGFEG